jgi:hypothetical protein
MKVDITGQVETHVRLPYENQAPAVHIKTTDGEVGAELDRSGQGLQVACIEITRSDGKTARYWVRVYVDTRGRPLAELRANHAQTQTTRELTGSWIDYEERTA